MSLDVSYFSYHRSKVALHWNGPVVSECGRGRQVQEDILAGVDAVEFFWDRRAEGVSLPSDWLWVVLALLVKWPADVRRLVAVLREGFGGLTPPLGDAATVENIANTMRWLIIRSSADSTAADLAQIQEISGSGHASAVSGLAVLGGQLGLLSPSETGKSVTASVPEGHERAFLGHKKTPYVLGPAASAERVLQAALERARSTDLQWPACVEAAVPFMADFIAFLRSLPKELKLQHGVGDNSSKLPPKLKNNASLTLRYMSRRVLPRTEAEGT